MTTLLAAPDLRDGPPPPASFIGILIVVAVIVAVIVMIKEAGSLREDGLDPTDRTRFVDKLRNAFAGSRLITPANLEASGTADFATFAVDHGPITIHSTSRGGKATEILPLADGRSRARVRAALAILADSGRAPLAPVLRTGNPPQCIVPVAPAGNGTAQ